MTLDRFAVCSWPVLTEPFASALRDAVEFILAEVDPIGIVATGTIIRGHAHASSDLDLYVVHLAPFRRRVQRFFAGVPAEIFINPPATIRRYFAEEELDGRRITAHMLATGFVVYRSDPRFDELRADAAAWLAHETRPSETEELHTRYALASRFEDAMDVAQSDDVTATMLLADVVTAMLELSCKRRDGRIPRRKELIAVVATHEPELARLATSFFRSGALAVRIECATALADRILGARGFFEWDSGPGAAAV
jgi:hypothetical protein